MAPPTPLNLARVEELRRFRNFALFWIIIGVSYFVGTAVVCSFLGVTLISAMPVLLLLSTCMLLASIWHAAAIISMSLRNLL